MSIFNKLDILEDSSLGSSLPRELFRIVRNYVTENFESSKWTLDFIKDSLVFEYENTHDPAATMYFTEPPEGDYEYYIDNFKKAKNNSEKEKQRKEAMRFLVLTNTFIDAVYNVDYLLDLMLELNIYYPDLINSIKNTIENRDYMNHPYDQAMIDRIDKKLNQIQMIKI